MSPNSKLPALLAGPVLMLGVAACASSARVAATNHSRVQPISLTAHAGRAPARPISPVSASFISASDGWLLGLRMCHQPGCSLLRLRTTNDGGLHWSVLPAPPTSYAFQGSATLAAAVSRIVFANRSDGWAFGPGLWATHDGGAVWHRVATSGRAVWSLAATPDRVIAGFSNQCQSLQCARFGVYTSPASADAWRPVPGASGLSGGPFVVVSGTTGYVTTGSVFGSRLLTGPANGSARWRALPDPCAKIGAVLAAAGRGNLALACGGEPGAGQQLKRAYLSRNDGHTWLRLADPPSGGYIGNVALTPAGTIMISGGRSDVYISWDHGRTWHTSPSLNRADVGDGLTATMYTATRGFVIQNSYYFPQIWFTRDDGHTWFAVSVR